MVGKGKSMSDNQTILLKTGSKKIISKKEMLFQLTVFNQPVTFSDVTSNDKIYLAHPYSGSQKQHQERFESASEIAAVLIARGAIVFSPISHSHPVDQYLNPKISCAKLWLRQDFQFIKWSDIVLIAEVDGWEDSSGIRAEVEFCNRIGKKVRLLRVG